MALLFRTVRMTAFYRHPGARLGCDAAFAAMDTVRKLMIPGTACTLMCGKAPTCWNLADVRPVQ
ncbi:hypothetical protein [Stenotrophomonas sp. CFBP 13725]|uniref:hypothetical protein n=1 Tax=Stenotrophomonas sp. CFBP 13725 TaxID=2775297 RepID=UPI00177E4CBF|nr:hypothetical protein [Stenotrophomonas sp. CFBP 13725]MBD8635930.1 hypothetical protein [Stenotrophomonas sp. CFBP 13725]